MGDYLRLLTVSDREIPLAALQRAASVGAPCGRSIIRAPSAIIWRSGPRATCSRTSGRPSSATRSAPTPSGPRKSPSSLTSSTRAVRLPHRVGWPITWKAFAPFTRSASIPRRWPTVPTPLKPSTRSGRALREVVGGIGLWDGQGFTNDKDQLVWCDPVRSSGWHDDCRHSLMSRPVNGFLPEINLSDPEELAAFLRGAAPRATR